MYTFAGFFLQVFLPVEVTAPSVYRMVLRYTNPNPNDFIGEVTVSPLGGYGGPAGEGAGEGGEAGEGDPAAAAGGAYAGDTQTHQVNRRAVLVYF